MVWLLKARALDSLCMVGLRGRPETLGGFSRLRAIAIKANVQIDMPFGGCGNHESPAFQIVAHEQPGQPCQSPSVKCHGPQHRSKVRGEDVLVMKTLNCWPLERSQDAPQA